MSCWRDDRERVARCLTYGVTSTSWIQWSRSRFTQVQGTIDPTSWWRRVRVMDEHMGRKCHGCCERIQPPIHGPSHAGTLFFLETHCVPSLDISPDVLYVAPLIEKSFPTLFIGKNRSFVFTSVDFWFYKSPLRIKLSWSRKVSEGKSLKLHVQKRPTFDKVVNLDRLETKLRKRSTDKPMHLHLGWQCTLSIIISILQKPSCRF